MRKKMSLFLVLLLLMTTPLQAFAQFESDFTDMPADWSTEALEAAVDNGLLNGHNGKIRPYESISRAEIATVINRAFGAHATASLDGFEDVQRDDWHYSELAKAVAMGTLKGDGRTLRPDSPVTREEAFTILGRALSIRATETNKSFVDLSAVSDWAREETLGLVNEGYINGSEGYLNPKAQITRAEFAQLMHNIIKEYIRTPGVVEEVSEGNVMINMPDVTLKGVTVTGDLIIGDGVGEGEVTLDDVTVKGRLLVRGGGENSIVIKGDSDVDTIIIVKNGNKVRILNESGEVIQVASVEGDADVILEGEFSEVTIKSPGITVNARNADIELAIIKGERSKFIVDEDSEIDKIDVIAANVMIDGVGEVDEVEVFAGGTGTTILTPNTEIDVNRGANNVIGTGDVEIEPNETYVNGSTPTKDAKPLKEESSGGSSGGGTTTPPVTVTKYTLNYSVIGSNGTLTATRTNGSSLEAGTTISFTAAPAEGYEVKEWKVNGAVRKTGGNTYTIALSSNSTVTVEFKLIPEPEMFTVIYNVMGENGTIESTISSGVGVEPNTELTFTATPSDGYEIKEWKVNNEVVEAGSTLTTTITAYTMVSVEFKETVIEPTMYTVTYSVIGTGGTLTASVPNGGQAQEGSSVDFTAVPAEGYRLKEWTVNGEVVDWLTSLRVSRDMIGDVDFKVEFELINPAPTTYTLTYSVIGEGGELSTSYASGTSVPINSVILMTATPDEGYRVKGWTFNSQPFDSTNTVYSFTMTRDNVVTVEFEEIPPIMYTVTHEVIGIGGTVEARGGLSFDINKSDEPIASGDELPQGSDFRFIITPDEHKQIRAITLNGGEVGKTNILDVESLGSNIHLTVEFETIEYSLNFSVVGGNGSIEATSTTYANVTDGMRVYRGTSLRFEALPDEGYQIKDWKYNGTSMGVSPSIDLTFISGDTNVTVEFEEISDGIHTVNFSTIDGIGSITANADGIGAISSGAEVPDGYDIIFTAEIPDGYRIKEWSVNGDIFYPYRDENTFIVHYIWANMNVTVEFEEIPIVTHEILIFVENVDGATVEVKDAENTVIPETKIQDKNYFYDLEVGSYTYTVSKDGYYTVERALEVTEPETEYVTMVEVLPGVVSVEEFPIYEMNVGGYEPGLPGTAMVTLDTSAQIEVSVVWDVSSFDKFVAGNYVLLGTLDLPDGVDNPMNIKAEYLIDVFAAPEITLDITNSNILRFDFDVPIVWVGEKDITEIGTPDYTTLAFLQDLFRDPTLDASVLNEENIEIVYGVGYLQINLLEDAINRDLFWELDHPGGIYGGNGDGIYRKDVTADLSIFNNHLGLASESTAEPFKLKFFTNYMYGLPDYDDVIGGVWQTAEQRANDIDPVRTMPTYEAIFTDTNVLRIESNQPIFFEGGPIWAGVDKALLLTQLFGRGEDPANIEDKFDVEKVGITMGDTAFEVQLFSGAFDSNFFWDIDHPDAIDPDYDNNPYPPDMDGNGVYRRLHTLDLGHFYNSSGDYVAETVDYYLKLYVPFENGAPRYDEPVQAAWQTVAQSELDDDPVLDSTSPSFVGITSNPVADEINGEIIERHIWIEEGDSIEFQITATDDNLRRMKVAEDTLDTVEGFWYYADNDVYNGPTDILAEEDEIHGRNVTYADGTWTMNFGPYYSSGFIFPIILELDFEDYAGNSWSDVETNLTNRTFVFIPRVLDRTDLNAIKAEIEGMIQAYYSPETWVAVDTAMDMPESTQEEIDAKYNALVTAKDNLYEKLAVMPDEFDVLSNSTTNHLFVLENDRGTGRYIYHTYGVVNGDITMYPEKLVYVPDAGFVGTETFNYTARTETEDQIANVTVNVGVLGEYITSGVAGDGTEYGFYSDEGGLKVIIENVNTKELNIESTVPEITITEGKDSITIQYFLGDDLHTKVIGKQVGTLTEPRIISSTFTTPLQALEILDVNGVGVNEIEVGKTYTLVYDIVPSDTTDVVNPVWSIPFGDATINSLGELIANSPGEITVRVNPSNPELAYIYDDFTLHAYNMHTISAEIVEGTEYGTIEMSIDGTPIDNPSEVKEGTMVHVVVTPIDETIEVVEWYYNGGAAPTTSFNGQVNVIEDTTIGVKLFKPNTPPVATDDSVEVNSGSTVLIDVLANDTDVDGDPLEVVVYSGPLNGTTLVEGSNIKYTSNDGFIGADEFIYQVFDDSGAASAAFVRITVNPDGTKLGTGSYQGNDISFFMGDSGLIAVLEGQPSTTWDVVDETYDSVIDVVSMDNSVALIYLREGNINVSRVVAIGQDAVESEHPIVQARGSLTSIQYVVDSNDVIHFTYFDSLGQSSMYEKPDLMYCNTTDQIEEVLHFGYRENMGGSDYDNSYVNEVQQAMAIDNSDNVVVMYVVRDWSSWMGGQDHNYYLRVKNTETKSEVNLENYYSSSVSAKFSNLDLTGGSDITANYTYSGDSYTRYFDGATLTEQ